MNTNPTILTEQQHNVLAGLMLGDGCLSIRKGRAMPRLTIRRQLSDLPYLQYTFEIFRNLCRDKAITFGSTYDARYDKNYDYCNLESRFIPAFLDYHKLWYPNKKKIVPQNLKLNKEIIAIWLCDDAYVGRQGHKRLKIAFHTQGFEKQDVVHLQHLLNERYKTHFTLSKVKNDKFIIVGADNQTRLLLEDIDGIFPESMSRKSNIWRDKNINFYENKPKQTNIYFNKTRNSKILILEECLKLKTFTPRVIADKHDLYHNIFNKKINKECKYVHSVIRSILIKNIKNNNICILNENNKKYVFSLDTMYIVNNSNNLLEQINKFKSELID